MDARAAAADYRQVAQDLAEFACIMYLERLGSSEAQFAIEAMRSAGKEPSAIAIQTARVLDEQARAGHVMGVRELMSSLSVTVGMFEQFAAQLESGQPQPTPEESI